MAGNANSGGRNAKSKLALVAAGTYRPDRHGDHETPAPPAGTPIPPKPLNAEEQGEWDRMVTRLDTAGTLTIVDDAALYQYVALFAEVETAKGDGERLRKMSEKLMRTIRKLEGSELVAAVQEVVKLQYLLDKKQTQLRQGHMAIRQYLVEFGQTTTARTRVKMPAADPGKKNDKKARYFGGAGA